MINLKKDKLLTGIIIGLLLPVMLFIILYEVFGLSDITITNSIIENSQLFLLAVNGIIMRQFIIKRGQDKIGKGILLITMVMALIYVLYYYT